MCLLTWFFGVGFGGCLFTLHRRLSRRSVRRLGFRWLCWRVARWFRIAQLDGLAGRGRRRARLLRRLRGASYRQTRGYQTRGYQRCHHSSSTTTNLSRARLARNPTRVSHGRRVSEARGSRQLQLAYDRSCAGARAEFRHPAVCRAASLGTMRAAATASSALVLARASVRLGYGAAALTAAIVFTHATILAPTPAIRLRGRRAGSGRRRADERLLDGIGLRRRRSLISTCARKHAAGDRPNQRCTTHHRHRRAV